MSMPFRICPLIILKYIHVSAVILSLFTHLLFLFPDRENYFPMWLKHVKISISGGPKNTGHVYIGSLQDELPSPLSWDSTHVAMSFARAIMSYIVSPLVMEKKVVDFNSRLMQYHNNERYFPRVLKTHFATYLNRIDRNSTALAFECEYSQDAEC